MRCKTWEVSNYVPHQVQGIYEIREMRANILSKAESRIGKKKKKRNSGQDGGIGRNPSLSHTTKRRITTNLKSINNQKCQNIKLHGTPTTMELKKQSNRTTRPVRQWMERNLGKVADSAGRAGCSKETGCTGGPDLGEN